MKHGLKSAAYSHVKTVRALGRGLPKVTLPKGLFLVHNLGSSRSNDVYRAVNDRGFRAWVQRGKANPPLVECSCKFGGLKNADVHKRHFIPEAWA